MIEKIQIHIIKVNGKRTGVIRSNYNFKSDRRKIKGGGVKPAIYRLG